MKGLSRSWLFLGWLVAAGFIPAAAENSGPPEPPPLPARLRSGEPTRAAPARPDPGSARSFLTQGQGFITEGRFSEAKEALRTAIRLEPMNLEAWSLYDYAAEMHYVGRAREERVNPVVERDLKPVFAILRVESFRELGTLYLVGELKNLSGELKQNIEVTATLLDKEKQEIRRETGYVRTGSRGLFPNEQTLFEIPVRDPPPGVEAYRVRVSRYE